MELIDTNIFLELLLDQDKAGNVEKFFNNASNRDIYISDFYLHSIGVILNHLRFDNVFIEFVKDVIINGELKILTLQPEDLCDIGNIIKDYKLDFDDAYQYLVENRHKMQLVSFDSDFDKTDINRVLPSEILDW